MSNTEKIKKAYQRNKKAVKMRPSVGKGVGKSNIRVKDGTTCHIKGSGWDLTADIGTDEGGNDAGPGPGVLERAALGSCLAIGYVQMAAVMEVPIDNIEVEVETDFDARGSFGLENHAAGFSEMRYVVQIESPASEDRIRKMIETSDNSSPVLDDFRRPIPVSRKVKITKS